MLYFVFSFSHRHGAHFNENCQAAKRADPSERLAEAKRCTFHGRALMENVNFNQVGLGATYAILHYFSPSPPAPRIYTYTLARARILIHRAAWRRVDKLFLSVLPLSRASKTINWMIRTFTRSISPWPPSLFASPRRPAAIHCIKHSTLCRRIFQWKSLPLLRSCSEDLFAHAARYATVCEGARARVNFYSQWLVTADDVCTFIAKSTAFFALVLSLPTHYIGQLCCNAYFFLLLLSVLPFSNYTTAKPACNFHHATCTPNFLYT